MDGSHLRGRDSSIPLLSDDADPQTNRDEAHSEDWTRSNTNGKYTKWVAFPYRQVMYALLAIIALIILGFSTYGSIVGYNAYRRLVFPHRAVHASTASAKDGSRVVTPYFSPKYKGGVQSGILLVKIWFKDQVDLQTLPVDNDDDVERYYHDRWAQERQYELMSSIGETGYVNVELLNRSMEGGSDWIEAYSTEIEIMDIERTQNKVAHVTLPGTIIHSLVNNSQALLVATFELHPDPTTIPSSVSYKHRSTRPISLYGPSQPWPLSYSPPEPISPSSLNDFFAHSAAGRSLRTRVLDWHVEPQMSSKLETRQVREERYATFISARTWVTMASEYSVYGVDQYMRAQDALKEFKIECADANDLWYQQPNQDECFRKFDRDGHFENLLEVSGPGEVKAWKYGPFLTTRLSPDQPDDYLELPLEAEIKNKNPADVQDFSFDWSIMYSAMSPAKLSLAQSTIGSTMGLQMKLYGDSYQAKILDEEEFSRAFLGLTVNQGSRPISRGLVQYISQGLRTLTIPLILHYWFTRRVSTGISLIPFIFQTIIDMIYYIVSSAVEMERVYILIFILAIISFVGIILKQIYLLFRPDFKFKHLDAQTQVPGLKYPIAVRFRSPTVPESQSQKLDAKFDYRLRILMTIITFCIFRFAPSLPAIVEARKYPDIMHGFGGFQHYNPSVLTAIHILAAIHSSIWLTSWTSQIVLNQRNRSFAGSYALTAYFQLGSLVFSQISRIFVGWFGKSHIMQPLTMWDIVMLLVSGVVVAQAVMFPKVEQVVEESLD